MPQKTFKEKVLDVVRKIPKGRVKVRQRKSFAGGGEFHEK